MYWLMSLVKVDNLEKELAKVKPFLEEYLVDQGYDCRNNKSFCCINPEHDDKNPSMSIFYPSEDAPMAHCFSCLYSADIFTAAHAIEDKPLVGPGFVSDNLIYLAEKFEVEVNTRAFTEEEIYELNTYEAYKAAANYIQNSPFSEKALEEINFRSWDVDFLKSHKVGCCDDYTQMRNTLKASGFAARFLDEIDLGNNKIFSPDNLIFTVADDFGRPVGFAARNLNYDGVRDDANGRLINGSKFTNTKTTGTKCNIYRKSERLYLLDVAKDHTPPLYIVEGYGDAISLHNAGLVNCVAIGSLELSEHHLNTCRRNGIYDVIICLDADDSGEKKARSLLDEVLVNVHDMKIRFIFLPFGENGEKADPDSYVRQHGLESFVSLPKVEPFEWRLQEFCKEETDGEVVCFKMIPIVANEPSPIRRESMIRELSEHTGFSEEVIKKEINKILESEEIQCQKRKDAVISTLKFSLDNNTESYETVLQTAIDGLYQLEREKAGGVLTPYNLLTDIRSIKDYEENEELHDYIDFGDNFSTLSDAFSGDIRQKVILLGGIANTGKTSKISNMAWNLAKDNADILSVVLTIDDSARDFVPRLVTYDIAKRTYSDNRSLFDRLFINRISAPFRFKHMPDYDEMMAERERSFKTLFDMTREEKLIVLDSTHGRSVEFLRATVRQLRERHSDKRIMIFLDNFHILDTSGTAEGREKYKSLSKALKNIAVDQDCTVVSTVEYTKLKKVKDLTIVT